MNGMIVDSSTELKAQIQRYLVETGNYETYDQYRNTPQVIEFKVY